jgi:S1-C subfamily serine protease
VDVIERVAASTAVVAAVVVLIIARTTMRRRPPRPDAGHVGVAHVMVVAAVLVGVVTGFAAAVPYATRIATVVRGAVVALAPGGVDTAPAGGRPATGSASTHAGRRHANTGPSGATSSTGATNRSGARRGATAGANPVTAAVRADAQGIVRVTGVAPACSLEQEGSGFVVSPDHVVTNAHVVHGLRFPRVQVGGNGYRYPARVVFYDPGVDLAVLEVPGLPARPLPLSTVPLATGRAAVAAGFPLDGPLTLSTGSIQRQGLDAGPPVGGAPTRERPVYQLSVVVRPGNSGGPLIAPDGRVVGVVFARGSSRTPIGFAITSQAALAEVQPALAATQRVSTGACG